MLLNGSPCQVLNVFSVVIGGFLFTLLTTAWSVLENQKLMNDGNSNTSNSDANKVSGVIAFRKHSAKHYLALSKHWFGSRERLLFL